MTTATLGTNATSSLVAFVQNSSTMTVADLATINSHILDDLVNGNPKWPTAYNRSFGNDGVLYVPNRGLLLVRPGDYVAYDASGWPILVSKNAIAFGSTSWAHNP